MPKTRIVTINAGGYTAIRATIPAHYMRIEQNAATKSKALMYKRRNLTDHRIAANQVVTFTDPITLETGKGIDLIGHGRSGILGKPPNYAGIGYPVETAVSATDSGGGDIVAYVKASDDASFDVFVIESESEL